MGSCLFQTVGHGETAQAAYSDALEEARAENGHQDGYSGDIQTTEGFKVVEINEGETINSKVDETMDNFSKWGPCGCIQLKKGKFLFYGWAAE
jgi:hypothetical protein